MTKYTPVNSVTLAITGASGFQYGWRLLQALLGADYRVYLLISDAAHEVAAVETSIPPLRQPEKLLGWVNEHFNAEAGQLVVGALDDWHSATASGSGAPHKMVICPCSGGTLSAIANGASQNLIQRAADVVIKEQHKLVLVTREMPLSPIHLEHMLKLARLGVVIAPASPGFYQHPATIDDLVNFVVARVLDQLDIPQNLLPRWGADLGNSRL